MSAEITESAAHALTLVREIASEPRPAGSSAEARARELCANRLREDGFAVAEHPFEYSEFPGRYATPLGALFVATVLAFTPLVAGRSSAGALAMLVETMVIVAWSARWAARKGVVSLPWNRQHSVNLSATRGTPRCWLVAHLDSKSQPLPTAWRAASLISLGAIWLITALVCAGRAMMVVGGTPVPSEWSTVLLRWLAVAAVVVAVPAVVSIVGKHSNGAIDNASGVAAVLLAARRLAGQPIGVLLTSAEELGMAGARVWARSSSPSLAINCDGVDDDGETIVMTSGGEGAVAQAARANGLRVRSTLPGLLTDGVALADCGWDVVTISRGSARTLRLIHTRADNASRLRGDGVIEVARAIEALARSVLQTEVESPAMRDVV